MAASKRALILKAPCSDIKTIDTRLRPIRVADTEKPSARVPVGLASTCPVTTSLVFNNRPMPPVLALQRQQQALSYSATAIAAQLILAFTLAHSKQTAMRQSVWQQDSSLLSTPGRVEVGSPCTSTTCSRWVPPAPHVCSSTRRPPPAPTATSTAATSQGRTSACSATPAAATAAARDKGSLSRQRGAPPAPPRPRHATCKF